MKKLIVIIKSLFLAMILLMIQFDLAYSAQFSQSARVDVKIGTPTTCVFSSVPVDLETPCGWPATGFISTLPFTGTHGSLSAIDIAANDFASGWPIFATHDGVATVITASQPDPRTPDNPPDNVVVITSSKYISKYQHLLKQCVADGTNISRGTLIGLMDSTGYSTGNHLHYDIANLDGSALSLEQFNQLVPAYNLGDSVNSSYSGGSC